MSDEDIKILEEIINLYKNTNELPYKFNKDIIQAIENIINRNKELEKTITRKMNNNKKLACKYLQERYKNRQLELNEKEQEIIDHIVIVKNKKPSIKTIIRKFSKERFLKIDESKRIAAQIIGCKYVDGLNLFIDGTYYGGIYYDDLARYNNNKTIVIINKFDGLTIKQCGKVIDYLQKEGGNITELKELDMI